MKPAHVCKHVRTKKMYVPALADTVFAQAGNQFTDTSPCWCNRTQTETGPDDKQVNLPACAPGRACFEE